MATTILAFLGPKRQDTHEGDVDAPVHFPSTSPPLADEAAAAAAETAKTAAVAKDEITASAVSCEWQHKDANAPNGQVKGWP